MNVKRYMFHSAVRLDKFLASTRIFMRSWIPSERTKTVFFPGCSLSGYNPEYVFKVRRYISERFSECGIISACCSKPLMLIGDKQIFTKRTENLKRELDSLNAEIIITACQNCYHILRHNITDRKIISLWPLMKELGLKKELRDKFSGLEAGIQDSCTASNEIITSVRELLRYMGVNAREFNGRRLQCCGGIQAVRTGDSKFGHECMMKRAYESPCPMIISYCASCRSAMSIGGRHRSIHILDLIFGDAEVSCSESNIMNRFKLALRLKEA